MWKGGSADHTAGNMCSRILDFSLGAEYNAGNRRPRLPVTRSQADGVFFLSGFLLPLVLVACATTRPPQATGGPLPTPSPTLLQNSTPRLALPNASPQATAPSESTPGCWLRGGSISRGEVQNPELARAFPYLVYLPPCYEASGSIKYPVLYLLHGLTYDENQWDDLGIRQAADRLILAGATPAFVIVMPAERTGLDLEAAILDGLLPHVQDQLRVRSDGKGRAIGGISRGAGWALRIGLKHPELFGAIGLHSPAVLPPDLFSVEQWLEESEPDLWPRLWIDIGDRDPLRFSTLELRDKLEETGVVLTWSLHPGEHAATFWREHLEEYLTWYSAEW